MGLKIGYTDKEITPWGGMVLLCKMLEKTNFSETIKSCPDLLEPGSNRGYEAKRLLNLLS